MHAAEQCCCGNNGCHLVYPRCAVSATAIGSTPFIAWEREYHHMASVGPSVACCLRGGLRTASSRVSQWKRRMCVARMLLIDGRATAIDWGALIARQLGWAPGPAPPAASVLSLLPGARAFSPPPTPAVLVPRSLRFGHAARVRRAAAMPRLVGQSILPFGHSPFSPLPGYGPTSSTAAPSSAPLTRPACQNILHFCSSALVPSPGCGPHIIDTLVRPALIPAARPRARKVPLGSGLAHSLLAMAAGAVCLACGKPVNTAAEH